MSLFTSMRNLLSGRRLRNKADGLAWIKPNNMGTGAEDIVGHVVRTVSVDANGFWELDPSPSYVARQDLFFVANGCLVPAGATVVVFSLHDDCLEPIRGNVPEEEVERLYAPGPVIKFKENV